MKSMCRLLMIAAIAAPMVACGGAEELDQSATSQEQGAPGKADCVRANGCFNRCPRLSPPRPGFCSTGTVAPEYNADGSCVTGYSCVTLKTAKTTVRAGDQLDVDIATTGTEDLFLPGCSPLSLQKNVNGKWAEYGPTHFCFFEGIAVHVKTSKTLNVRLSEVGTYRLVTSFAVRCDANKPLSQANCKERASSVISNEFVVTNNACLGAWLDQQGGCRGPADGTLPESCCKQERTQTCMQIATKYTADVRDARACDALATAPQCRVKVPSSLMCGCDTFVNSDLALKPHLQQWTQYKCNSIGFMCPAVMCVQVRGATCKPGSNSAGTCSDDLPF